MEKTRETSRMNVSKKTNIFAFIKTS